jgi:hypothetical protein
MWREQLDFSAAMAIEFIAPDLRGLGENVAETSLGDSSSSADHRLKSVPPATMEAMARDVAPSWMN